MEAHNNHKIKINNRIRMLLLMVVHHPRGLVAVVVVVIQIVIRLLSNAKQQPKLPN